MMPRVLEGIPRTNSYTTTIYLTKPIKDVVEKYEHCSTCHLGNVVERLAGVVPHTGILVLKTGQDRLDQFWEMHTY